MPMQDVYMEVWAGAVYTGFYGLRNFQNILEVYDDLQVNPGSNIVHVEVWSDFTIHSMDAGEMTPCTGDPDACEDLSATLIDITLTNRYIPTRKSLSDFNIFTDKQLAGAVERMVQNLKRDFEVVAPNFSLFDIMWTDAVFNGAANNMPILELSDTAVGYANLAVAISRAQAKDGGSGVAALFPTSIDGWASAIPDRDIDRILKSQRGYTVMGNADTFAVTYAGGTRTGLVGFIYPINSVAYAAPNTRPPSSRDSAALGNFWAAELDDARIPGRAMFIGHHYGLQIVREGDVQAVVLRTGGW